MIAEIFKNAYETQFKLDPEDFFSSGPNLTVLNSVYFACVTKYGAEKGSDLFDQCNEGMKAMGYEGHFDLPSGEVRQSARLLWLIWCELMAKEQGV